jgi:cell division protease FtsH
MYSMPSFDRNQRQEKPNGRRPAPGERGGRQQLPPNLWFWWFIFAALLAWNLFAWWPSQSSVATIPYSTFLTQVRTNNVAKVHIVGDDISGNLVKPLLWPQQHPARPAASSSSGSSAPTPSTQPHSGSHGTGKGPAAKAGPQEGANPAPALYFKFRTIFPSVVGDPNLIALLEAHHVVVDVSSSPGNSWLVSILVDWLPILLLIGIFWWMAGRGSRAQSGMFGFGRMKARRYSAEQPRVTFADVAGADEAKAELQEEVDFLTNPGKYHALGARIPKGVLLVGPPGTGKTLMARAVAGEAGVPFFSINASEFVEMFVGIGASRVRDLFRQAKEAAPAILFIDELDAVGRRRGAGVGTVNDEREQTLNQLLGELDGFDPRQEVIILAATNRPDVLDPALLRPGRFDRQVVVGLPDRKGREAILRIHARPMRLADDVNFPRLAGPTIGLSGADLANLCNEAALAAARHGGRAVSMADFEEAHDKIRLGAAHPQLIEPKERRLVAYHEAGHAIAAWFTPDADPVQKVTIVPHGQALGVTEQVPGEERHNLSQSYLRARLVVMLGGRTAEEIVFGEITTGAENDLIEATRLARRMVTRWGMSKLGLIAFQVDEQQPFLGYELAQRPNYSEATAAEIDAEVKNLLEQSHEQVRRLLNDSRHYLDRLVETLLEEETAGLDKLTQLLGPRPQPQAHHPIAADGTSASAGEPVSMRNARPPH